MALPSRSRRRQGGGASPACPFWGGPRASLLALLLAAALAGPLCRAHEAEGLSISAIDGETLKEGEEESASSAGNPEIAQLSSLLGGSARREAAATGALPSAKATGTPGTAGTAGTATSATKPGASSAAGSRSSSSSSALPSPTLRTWSQFARAYFGRKINLVPIVKPVPLPTGTIRRKPVTSGGDDADSVPTSSYGARTGLGGSSRAAKRNIGKTWKYKFELFGQYVQSPGGDLEAMGIAEVNITMLAPTLFSQGEVSFNIQARVRVYNTATSGFPKQAWIGRGSMHTEGPVVFAFPSRFKAVKKVPVLKGLIGDTSAYKSPGFEVSVSRTMEYLLLYPAHHFMEISTTMFPEGAIRGQLVKTRDSA